MNPDAVVRAWLVEYSNFYDLIDYEFSDSRLSSLSPFVRASQPSPMAPLPKSWTGMGTGPLTPFMVSLKNFLSFSYLSFFSRPLQITLISIRTFGATFRINCYAFTWYFYLNGAHVRNPPPHYLIIQVKSKRIRDNNTYALSYKLHTES